MIHSRASSTYSMQLIHAYQACWLNSSSSLSAPSVCLFLHPYLPETHPELISAVDLPWFWLSVLGGIRVPRLSFLCTRYLSLGLRSSSFSSPFTSFCIPPPPSFLLLLLLLIIQLFTLKKNEGLLDPYAKVKTVLLHLHFYCLVIINR